MYCVITNCTDGLYRRNSDVFKTRKDAVSFARYAIERMRRVTVAYIVRCDKSGNWSKAGVPVDYLNPMTCDLVAAVEVSSVVKSCRWS